MSENRIVALHGSMSSVVVEHRAGGAPLWRHWGARLAEPALPPYPLASARYGAPSSLEDEVPLTLLPTFGVGGFGPPALLAHRDGYDFAHAFDACTLQCTPGALHFTLRDGVAGLRAELSLTLDAADVLRIDTTLVNEGSTPLALQWLAAATLPLPPHARRVRALHGAWANEFRWHEEPLGASGWQRESRRGRPGHDGFPGAIVIGEGCTDHAGHAWGSQLAWSGNNRLAIAPRDEGGWLWQLGEWLAPGEVTLAPGQAYAAPQVVAVFSAEGGNGVARAFHAAARAAVRWPGGAMAPRPVHLNTWEAVYFDHDERELRALAEAAAALGVERFVLDDGWFQGRRDDSRALGDWWPDETKYPHGLAALAAHVRLLGMQFGLWVEPEMISPDSELYRAHPEWALQIAGRPLLTARRQLVLDLQRPGVAGHLLKRLGDLLSSLPVAYLKWDMNRDLTTAGHEGRAGYRGQVLALYALLERLRAAHPQVEMEACAGGGARIDLGLLPHAHRFWTSDNNDARSRAALQRAALHFMPPELLGAHVGAARSHTTGRSQALAFRAAVALPLHLGVEADVRRLDETERLQLARWIALHKQLRGRLHGAPLWQGEAGDGIVWQAHGDADAALLFVYRLEPTAQRWSPALRMPWLDPARRYRVRRLCGAAQGPLPGGGCSALHEALEGAGTVLPGAWLREAGLELPRLAAESALILDVGTETQETA